MTRHAPGRWWFLSPGCVLAAFLIAASAHAQDAVPVMVALVESAKSADKLSLTGTVTSARVASLSPSVDGLVKRVRVDAGDRVTKGKALIDLDSVMAKLALERTKAAAEEARAHLSEQDRLLNEAREMFERGLIPETRTHSANSERRVAAARVDRLVAEQKEQEEIVRRHTVVAPFTGVVSDRFTDPGEWVETGSAVLEIVDTRRLRIDVQVPQERYRQISVGSPVSVELDANAGRVLKGKIIARVPVNNPGARTFLVRVGVDKGVKMMAPGMSTRVVFTLSGERSTVRVPRDAILRKPDGTTSVWVVNQEDDSSVSERQVELGRSLRGWIDVKSGIDAGMRVVVRGNETLREGQKVRILTTVPGTSGAH
jgi:RND family efflux transporter MFP subunit